MRLRTLNLLISKSRPNHGWALLVFVVLGLSSCAKIERPAIEDRIHSPFDVVYVPKWSDYLVLSGNFDKRYEGGNIVRASVSPLGEVTKRQYVNVPRLGLKLALNPRQDRVAVAYAEETLLVQSYALSDEGVEPEVVGEWSSDLGGVVTNLRWLTLVADGSERSFLLVEANGYATVPRIYLLEETPAGLELFLSFPEDLEFQDEEIYKLGFGAPIFDPETKLLVLFPAEGAGVKGTFPSPYDVLKEESWFPADNEERTGLAKVTADPRLKSLAVIDIEGYLRSGDLVQSTIYTPFVFNPSLEPPDFSEPADSDRNKEQAFRSDFRSGQMFSSLGCESVEGEISPNSAIVYHRRTKSALTVEGFAEAKAMLRERLAAVTVEKPVDALVFNALRFATFLQVENIAAEGLGQKNLLLTDLEIVNIASQCRAVFNFVEIVNSSLGQSNAGRERSWAVTRNPLDPGATLSVQLPGRASSFFAGAERDLLFGSFSQNRLTLVRLEDDRISVEAEYKE